MEICTCPSSSSSTLMEVFTERVRESCRYAVSEAIRKLFYVIFAFLCAVVGATMGAMIGAWISLKMKSNLFYGTAIGAIRGAIFFIEVFKISLDLLNSTNKGLRRFVSLIDTTAKLFSRRVVGEQFSPTVDPSVVQRQVPKGSAGGLSTYSAEKIPEFRITYKHILDTCGSRASCSICLQDFELEETVRSLPPCHHTFHLPCIDKWLMGHGSCPSCRRSV